MYSTKENKHDSKNSYRYRSSSANNDPGWNKDCNLGNISPTILKIIDMHDQDSPYCDLESNKIENNLDWVQNLLGAIK